MNLFSTVVSIGAKYGREDNSQKGTNETKILEGNALRATRFILWNRTILLYFLILPFLDLSTLDIIYWLPSMKKGYFAHLFLSFSLLPLLKFAGYVSIVLLLSVFFSILNCQASGFCSITYREPLLSIHQEQLAPLLSPFFYVVKIANVLFCNWI